MLLTSNYGLKKPEGSDLVNVQDFNDNADTIDRELRMGDSAENTLTFDSGDAEEANVWTDVDTLVSGEKHKSIFNKVSTMFKNIRYLYKMLGNTDISDHGGTVTNAILLLSGSTFDLQDQIDAQNDALASIWQHIYPVGSIYMSVNNTSPQTLFGGTWVAWGAGRVPVGVDTSNANFKTVEKTGGEITHTLTVNEMPSHTHAVTEWLFNGSAASGIHYGKNFMADNGMAYTGGSNIASNSNTGGGVAHNNLQPYITCYMWKRTA